MPKSNLYSVIDVETTGGDPKVDRITEIAVFLFDGEEVIDSFISLVNPTMPISPFITKITGIDNEMVAHAPKFYEIAKQVVEITQGAIFVAHNSRFDYSFIQKEFRQLGYTFTRKQLCTVKLSRRLLPGHKSYSLGKLCKSLKIENEGRHRAWGDAKATVQLLQHLLQVDQGEKVEEVLGLEISRAKLPPKLAKTVVDELPEETGVYYFHNQRGDILYVGKSNNVRKRILSHFQGAFKATRTIKMVEQIYDISYTLTGSELIALLLENEEIKLHQPRFNRAQRRKTYKYGIYSRETEAGYLELYVDKFKESLDPLAGFTGKTAAEGALIRRGRKHELCPKYYGQEKGPGRCFHHQLHICKGACVGEETIEDYNQRVLEAMGVLNYGRNEGESFLIVGEGRNYDERSVVWIKNGTYQGYTYIAQDYLQESPDHVFEEIPWKKQAPDVQRIIQQYIRKHPKEVVPLSSPQPQ
ncbi:MAG: exonuclease domain-containing protein [Bacteroidota bacterium]